MENAIITSHAGLLAILLAVPALIFYLAKHPATSRPFRVIPAIVFAYFIPTALASAGLIPHESEFYTEVRHYVLPASLLLLIISVDLPGVWRLGPKALYLFLVGTLGIVIGGPVTLLLVQELFPTALPADAWKGLAALSGSWIGGGANFVAVGDSVGASNELMGLMVIVDVGVANVWTGFLMYFAGKYQSIDKQLGADNSSVEELKQRVITFQKRTARVTSREDLFVLAAMAFGAAYLAYEAGQALPEVGDIISKFTWTVIIITTLGVGLSFTPVRNYEGAGASKLGEVLLYMLIGVIGASADFVKIFENWQLILVGALWLSIHILLMYGTMRLLKAPLFFMAVGSQANVGGAASAPIVASAFHPSLATVGVLLGVFGYVLGTYAALICAFLLSLVAG